MHHKLRYSAGYGSHDNLQKTKLVCFKFKVTRKKKGGPGPAAAEPNKRLLLEVTAQSAAAKTTKNC